MTDQNLDADLLSVDKLFSEAGVRYEVPIYQRNYAWGQEEITRLIDDVKTAMDSTSEADGGYFLGNLVVALKIPDEGSLRDETAKTVYEVVDGQQRLTTLTMLRTYLAPEGAAGAPILEYASRPAASNALTRPTENAASDTSGIADGYTAIHDHFDPSKWTAEEKERFRNYLDQHVHLVRSVLPASTELNRYFEIMNTRGQQLEQVDIVKARLMKELQGNGKEQRRAAFAGLWDACSDMDHYIQMSLRPPIAGHHSPTEFRREVFGEDWNVVGIDSFDELAKYYEDAGSSEAPVGGLSLGDAIEFYAESVDGARQLPDDEDIRFESPIRFPNLLLHVLAITPADRSGSNEPASVEGSLDDSTLVKTFEKALPDKNRDTWVADFAMTLLRCRFLLDNYVLKREFTPTNADPDGQWSLKRLVKSRAKNSASYVNAYPTEGPAGEADESDTMDGSAREVLLLQSLLRVTYTSPRTMRWITRLLRLLVDHDIDRKGVDRGHTARLVAGDLREHIRSTLEGRLPDDRERTGFGIDRLVFTYLDFLIAQGEFEGVAADETFSFHYRTSIEHFFPQHADTETTGHDVVESDDKEMNLFGNLALVSVSANSKFSNALPVHKAAKENIINQSPKLKLMATRAGTWDKTAIRSHHKAMVDLLTADVAKKSSGDRSLTP